MKSSLQRASKYQPKKKRVDLHILKSICGPQPTNCNSPSQPNHKRGMREEEVSYTFPVPWEHATLAFWCKYPHPELPHVRDALVLSREVDVRGRLRSTRLMCVQQPIPALLRRFAASDHSFALEESVVDPVRQEMIITTRNITFDGVLKANEECIYRRKGSNATAYFWKVNCEVNQPVPLLTGKIEEALVQRAKSNSEKGLSKMQELAELVHRRVTAEKDPPFLRWPSSSFQTVTSMSASKHI